MLITFGAEGPGWAVISFSGLGNQAARLTAAPEFKPWRTVNQGTVRRQHIDTPQHKYQFSHCGQVL